MPSSSRRPDKPLTDTHKRLHRLALNRRRKVEVWMPDLDGTAEELGVSRAYVLDLIGDLERRGAVEKLEGRRGVYQVKTKIPPVGTKAETQRKATAP